MIVARPFCKKVSTFVMPEAGHLNPCSFGIHAPIKGYDQFVNSHNAIPSKDMAEQLRNCVWKRTEKRKSKQKFPHNYSFPSDFCG